MKTEKLILDNSSERKEIKQLSQALPNIWISIFTAALIVESINLCDLSGFMISSQNSDTVFVSNL